MFSFLFFTHTHTCSHTHTQKPELRPWVLMKHSESQLTGHVFTYKLLCVFVCRRVSQMSCRCCVEASHRQSLAALTSLIAAGESDWLRGKKVGLMTANVKTLKGCLNGLFTLREIKCEGERLIGEKCGKDNEVKEKQTNKQ